MDTAPLEKKVRLAAGVALVLGALSLAGWCLKWYGLASFGTSFIPMAPLTAILLPLLAVAFVAVAHGPDHPLHGKYIKAVSLLTLGVSIWTPVVLFGGTKIDVEGYLLPQGGNFGQVALGRMSPLTSLSFGILALVLFLLKPGAKRRQTAAGTLSVIGTLVPATILIGYVYGTPMLYGGLFIPMALTTAISLLSLYLSAILIVGKTHFPLKVFAGASARAQMLRAFLPASFFAVLLHGLIFQFVATHLTANYALLSALSAFVFTLVATLFTLKIASSLGTRIDEAEKQTEQLSRLKTDFINNMSHELRTPLNSVIGMSEVLQAEPLSSQQRECVDTIHHSGHRLLRLVDDILCFSVAHTEGQLALDNAPFDLSEMIQKVVTLSEPAAARKGVHLEISLPADLPLSFLGDGKHISEVLIRLVDNAVKFTPTGKITIAVEKEKETQNYARLRFDVIDTGQGIPREVQKGIFGIFFQVDTTSLRKYGGLGIGLALCKTIVDSMGGTIGYTSDPGQGARFWFSLDIRKRSATDLEATPTLDRLHHGRILVAEDDVMNQVMTKYLLEKIGYESGMASDGREAVQLFSKSKYDLVLMDCQMPQMDGYQATKLMRDAEASTGQHIPIIALTAHVSLAEKEKCLTYGMDDFICKPAQMETLKNKIGYWLHRAAS